MDRPAVDRDEACGAETADNPQQKRARMDRTWFTLHDMFDEILEENGPERPRLSASQQLDRYFAEVSIPRNDFSQQGHLEIGAISTALSLHWHRWHADTYLPHAPAQTASGCSAPSLVLQMRRGID
ncbi:hypothetical protein AAFF_G00184230 [Aldrovandia affinis]|uniref:Uncharacterized protein n=1 Tax=Aldrovandia affinis TaxID=143900 RepID=A0AAD7RMM6_9TELE|nr:hypothetical protein AAFF_G00184230 [Aldrovandia affinis]